MDYLNDSADDIEKTSEVLEGKGPQHRAASTLPSIRACSSSTVKWTPILSEISFLTLQGSRQHIAKPLLPRNGPPIPPWPSRTQTHVNATFSFRGETTFSADVLNKPLVFLIPSLLRNFDPGKLQLLYDSGKGHLPAVAPHTPITLHSHREGQRSARPKTGARSRA